MRIALTGGIACGKSLFSRYLNELGIATCDADDVVHALEAPGGAAVPAIVARFGRDVLTPDGGIDRARLASVVFNTNKSEPLVRTPNGDRPLRNVGTATGGDKSRRDLEAILFPLVRRTLLDFCDGRAEIRAPSIVPPAGCVLPPALQANLTQTPSSLCASFFSVPPRIAVIPLLFESQWDTDYDIILCIRSSVNNQIERMIRTRGYSRHDVEARLAAQMPVAEKATRSDFVVINDSDSANLLSEARRLADWLKERIHDGR